MKPDSEKLTQVCLRALQWAKAEEYEGWEKHDALNSPLLSALLGWGKWPRILAIQGVMRFPVNLRPLLGVRKHKNPKGIALFARAWLNLYSVTGEENCLEEAKGLLDWLLDNPTPSDWPGTSWGYPYPWQDPGFYAPPDSPNRIVTYFAGRALIHGYEITGDARYLEGANQAVKFILEAPKVLYEDPTSLCLSYIPNEKITMAVMDVSALCGALCAMVGHYKDDNALLRDGEKLVNWVVDKQTDYGAWYYTHPPGDSHITHDNYHTGEIVDAIREYMDYSGNDRFQEACETGLRYYRDHLFTTDLRPKWMNDQTYPHDIHGYSQGIISFNMAGDLKTSQLMAETALSDMWKEPEGRFYYQKRRFHTRKFTFMRWCQAWMSFAISCLLRDETRFS